MAILNWTDDPLSGVCKTRAVYLQEIQHNTNERQVEAGVDKSSWIRASTVDDFFLEHCEELKRALESSALLDYWGFTSIADILGRPWTPYAERIREHQKIAGYQILNDMRKVIDSLNVLYGKFMYVPDQVNDRIVKTKWDGTGWQTLSVVDAPRSVYYDAATEFLYILRLSAGYVVKTKIDGSESESWGSSGSGTGQFNTPIEMDYSDGYFFIADHGNNRIVKTKYGGEGWQTWGGNDIQGVAAYGNYVFYSSKKPWDNWLWRIDQTTGEQTKLGGWAHNGPYGVHAVGEDSFYVCDVENHRIVETNMAGSPWTDYSVGSSFPGSVFVIGGQIYWTKTSGGTVYKWGDGALGGFSTPRQVHWG